MRNKLIATGVAVGVGLAANAAPAMAGSGGVAAEGVTTPDQMGGVSATPAAMASGQTGEATPQQQRQLLQQAIENPDTRFTALPVYTPTGDITVESKQGDDEMVDPLTIEYGGQLADFAGVSAYGGKPHIEMLAADKAKVLEYIGNRVIDVQDPQRFIVERTLHFTAGGTGYGAEARFTDGTDSFGVMP